MNKSEAPIATPCGASWEAMTPESGARLCATCDKLVHDLSSMTEPRARRLLASKENLCVRYLFDEHGNIWFAGDRPPLAARLLNRMKRGAAVAIAMPLLQACMGGLPLEDRPVIDADGGDGGLVPANPQVTDHAGRDAADGADADAGSDTNNDGG